MTIHDVLREARTAWGDKKLSLPQILIRLGVIYGDLCRWERNATKDSPHHTDEELQKELGNIIVSMIRWCDDLGYDLEDCVALALDAQKKFAAENPQR